MECNTSSGVRQTDPPAHIADSVVIDEEFASLCPPQSETELALLEQSLVDHGCRDALIAWRQVDGPPILLDGHTRKALCESVGCGFKVKQMDFPDRAAAVEFIVNNQLGRRNLTEEQKSYLRGRRYKSEKSARGGDKKSKGQIVPLIGDTSKKLAEEFGVSPKKIKRDATFATAVDAIAAADPAAKEPLKTGKVKLTAKAAGAVLEMGEEQVADIAKAVTAGTIKTVAEAIPAKTKAPTVRKDPNGLQIPKHLFPVFDQQSKFRSIVQQIGTLITAVEELAQLPAGTFLAERLQSIKSDLKNAQAGVKFSMPYQVCPYCKGKACNREGANKTACRETGWAVKLTKGAGQ